MAKADFFEIWQTITGLQGEEFHTKSGLPFTFTVKSNVLTTSRTIYNISKKEFEKAYSLMPLRGPGEINDKVRGPAYVYAILIDPRVANGGHITSGSNSD
jgi:hypothetical protein